MKLLTPTQKSRYDFIAKKLSLQAKKRREAREAGAAWKIGHPEEVKYWALKEQLERLEGGR